MGKVGETVCGLTNITNIANNRVHGLGRGQTNELHGGDIFRAWDGVM